MPNSRHDSDNDVARRSEEERNEENDENEDLSDNSLRDSESDDYIYNDSDDESYESEEDDGSGRTLLFLCEEGQLDTALKRVREWDEQFPLPGTTIATTRKTTTASTTTTDVTIKRELFRKNPNTGNYCLHEILAGGTCGKSAPELVERLIRRYKSVGTTLSAVSEYQTIFKAQPTIGSNGRTILHWCAWSKTTPKILRLVLDACPEAMCLRDNRSHFSRTPLEIAQRYWPDDEITGILKSSLNTYLPYRLRICVRLCVEQLFLKRAWKPFDKKDRRIARLAPRPWFVASVLGYSLQREMKGLAWRILSFVGCGAKLNTKRRSTTKKKSKTRPNGACKKKKNESSKAESKAGKSKHDEVILPPRKKYKTRHSTKGKGS